MLFEQSEFIECFGKSDIWPLSQDVFALFLFASVFFLVTERK